MGRAARTCAPDAFSLYAVALSRRKERLRVGVRGPARVLTPRRAGPFGSRAAYAVFRPKMPFRKRRATAGYRQDRMRPN